MVREVLRCHFSSEDILDKKLFENCKTHIKDDIKKYNIKTILVVGEAIKLIFSGESDLQSKINKKTLLFDLPIFSIMGASRICFMEEKKMPQKRIKEEIDSISFGLQQFKTLLSELQIGT